MIRATTPLLIVLFFISCNSQNRKTKRFGDQIIESNFIDDSILNGPTIYFSLDHQLKSAVNYSNGEKNGLAIVYYPDGAVLDSSNYEHGKKNGFHYVFDSLGSLIYRDYYYYGKQIGEQLHYKKGRVFQFIFSNFEGKNIFSCEYDSIGMKAFNGDMTNINVYSVTKNGKHNYGLFAYLLNPPMTQVKYSLGTVDTITNIRKNISSFDVGRMFVDTLLNDPPPVNKYYLSVDYKDSANKINKVYFTILELSDNLKVYNRRF